MIAGMVPPAGGKVAVLFCILFVIADIPSYEGAILPGSGGIAFADIPFAEIAFPGMAFAGIAVPAIAFPGIALPGNALGMATPGIALPGVTGMVPPGIALAGIAVAVGMLPTLVDAGMAPAGTANTMQVSCES